MLNRPNDLCRNRLRYFEEATCLSQKDFTSHPLRGYPNPMTGTIFACFLAWLVFAITAFAQADASQAAADENKAFSVITELMRKTREGGKNPSDQDLQVRREAALEMARKAKDFLRTYPKSKKAQDAQALLNIALLSAALAGDSASGEELHRTADDALKDPKFPEELKYHIFIINYIAEWAKKNGKRAVDEGSAEFQTASMEGLFAAVDVLADKDAIFKTLLLQAKSAQELTEAQKQELAQRVLKHPKAAESIKAEARKILSREEAYAVGKPLDISFTAVDGTKVDLKQMKGKVVLVDFWATWCGPCVGEVPNLKRVYEAYHDKGFEIVGISLDEKKADLVEFTKSKGMPWPQYFDGKHWNNEISFRFGINSVPTEWVVDKKGILREINARGNLAGLVERLLNEEN
jgi:thiol-disulfide isomerase/thioredoxin